jgi:FAD/FMN-containing dehydrogenase
MIPVYGHAADGNLHVNVMYDRNDEVQDRVAHQVVERILRKTLELGGTLSGEHGIGRSKRQYMHLQFGEDTVEYFHQIKKVWDPGGLFNPGIMIPEENCAENP